MFNFFKKDKIDDWKPIVEKINSLETHFEEFSDEQLKAETEELKRQIASGKLLDDILPEAFAIVRESAKRTLKQRHFDVQILGGIALHKGMAVEMMTGEGKTLVATLPAYLNALACPDRGGVHIITVNDYLAQRDAVWMGQIYHLLGLSVGCIVHEASFIYDPTYIDESQRSNIKSQNLGRSAGDFQSPADQKTNTLDTKRDIVGAFKVVHEFLRPISRKEAYETDILYGTNHEFGFDYLRDNLTIEINELVQKELNFAIVDEIDSILIDEARTPLIISSYEKEAEDVYHFYDKLAKALKPETHFTIDEKKKSIYLTEEGQEHLEKILKYNPYAVEDLHSIHHLEEALKANYLFSKDKDYIVKNNEVVIVDEFTGRLMWGRRWSGGLHQAVEAKEEVSVQPESKTIASITLQNLFKKYKKLSGMSGTVITSAEEFYKVYKLESVKIPTNKNCIRIDNTDKIFMNQNAKWNAVVEKIIELHSIGRPVLVGTTSIEKNELLHKRLEEKGIPHNVLNAKNHEEEGNIIAQAGKLKAITVATNMAGRGVDIMLGGALPSKEERNKILEIGGLFVLGTERHEARRIDNQLRGRTGRQGDKGETQFFISLEDELIRIFGGDAIKNIVGKFKIPENQAIENSIISKVIEEAQAKVEGLNFDIRKHLVEYDDVINAQREKIYDERKNILLAGADLRARLPNGGQGLNADSRRFNVEEFIKSEFEEFLKEPLSTINFVFGFEEENENKENQIVDNEEAISRAREKWENHLRELKSLFIKKSEEGEDEELLQDYQKILRVSVLRIYDYLWSEHLSYLDEIKESVGYRAYGQRDPLIEFKKEALESFDGFHKLFRFNLFQYLLRLRNEKPEIRSEKIKIGRNEPCPCGSGKKYKKCCGK